MSHRTTSRRSTTIKLECGSPEISLQAPGTSADFISLSCSRVLATCSTALHHSPSKPGLHGGKSPRHHAQIPSFRQPDLCRRSMCDETVHKKPEIGNRCHLPGSHARGSELVDHARPAVRHVRASGLHVFAYLSPPICATCLAQEACSPRMGSVSKTVWISDHLLAQAMLLHHWTRVNTDAAMGCRSGR